VLASAPPGLQYSDLILSAAKPSIAMPASLVSKASSRNGWAAPTSPRPPLLAQVKRLNREEFVVIGRLLIVAGTRAVMMYIADGLT
jgi:hypothetical protein